MNPITLHFKEFPVEDDVSSSLIEYDSHLNLNVLKHNREPAIDVLRMQTETCTKSGEVSDSDYTNIGLQFGTQTGTRTGGEETDSDYSIFKMLGSGTVTTNRGEQSDRS